MTLMRGGFGEGVGVAAVPLCGVFVGVGVAVAAVLGRGVFVGVAVRVAVGVRVGVAVGVAVAADVPGTLVVMKEFHEDRRTPTPLLLTL